MNQVKNKLWNKSTVLWLMGFLIFSPFSSYLTIDILHLPISAPEVLLIPFLPWCFRNLKFKRLISSKFVSLVLISLVFLAIAIVHGRFSVYAIVGAYRLYFYAIIFYCYFSERNNVSLHDMYILCMGSTIGWVVTAVVFFRTVTLIDGISVCYGPMLIISYTFCYDMLRGRLKRGVIDILLFVVIGIIGALRRVWAILAIQLIVVSFLLVKKRFVNLFKLNTLLAGLVVIFIFVSPVLVSSIQNVSHAFYFRVVEKTESMFNGESNGGDEGRIRMITEALNRYETDLFPKGYISKNTGADHTLGEFFDVPFKELTHTFGYFGAIFICLFFGWLTIRLYNRVRRGQLPTVDYCYVVSYISMIALLFLEGSFLSYPYMSIFTGYSLGCISRYSGLRFNY